MVAETPSELQLLHDKQRIEEEAGLETHVLDGPRSSATSPRTSPTISLGAAYCPQEGHANPLPRGAALRASRGRGRRRRSARTRR